MTPSQLHQKKEIPGVEVQSERPHRVLTLAVVITVAISIKWFAIGIGCPVAQFHIAIVIPEVELMFMAFWAMLHQNRELSLLVLVCQVLDW